MPKSRAEAIRHWLRNGADLHEHDRQVDIPNARDWKDLRPRRRTGPMLRIRRNGKVER